MIDAILPASVAYAEAFFDPPEAMLFAEEAALVSRSVDTRRREFTTVRHCARRALAELGVAPLPILRGDRGAPQWPAGFVGSMTHCRNYRAAVVAPAATVATVGIDAEPHEPLPDGVLGAISLADERAHVADLRRARVGVCWDRLLFCAKEATYKAWFPLMRTWLDFGEADVTFDPVEGTFTSRLLVPGPFVEGVRVQAFNGRWVSANEVVAAAIVLPR